MWTKNGDKGTLDALRVRVAELERDLEFAKGSGSNVRYISRIAQLEAQVEELRGINAESPGIVALRDALINAREKLVAQDAVLRQLTAHPTPYATVLHLLYNGVVVPDPTFEDFKTGTKVRIRRDSLYARQNSGAGTIIDDRHSYGARVRFEDGTANNYRIGRADIDGGAIDLELADPPKGEAGDGGCVIFFDGKVVEVDLPQSKKVEPGDTVKVNGETVNGK